MDELSEDALKCIGELYLTCRKYERLLDEQNRTIEHLQRQVVGLEEEGHVRAEAKA